MWVTLFTLLYKSIVLNSWVLQCITLVLNEGLSVLDHSSIILFLFINITDMKTNNCRYNMNDEDQKHQGSHLSFSINFVEWP